MVNCATLSFCSGRRAFCSVPSEVIVGQTDVRSCLTPLVPTYGKATAANHNGGNYLFRVVIGIVEMANTERHPHKVGNIARLHLLHDRSPVMLNRSRADP